MRNRMLCVAILAAGLSTGCGSMIQLNSRFGAAGIDLKVDNATDGYWLPQVNNEVRAWLGPGDSREFPLRLPMNGLFQDPYREYSRVPLGGKVCGGVVRVKNVAGALDWTADPRFGDFRIDDALLESNPSERELRRRAKLIGDYLKNYGEIGREEKLRQLDRWISGLKQRGGIAVNEWDCDPDSWSYTLRPVMVSRSAYRYGYSAERRLIVLRGVRGHYDWQAEGWNIGY